MKHIYLVTRKTKRKFIDAFIKVLEFTILRAMYDFLIQFLDPNTEDPMIEYIGRQFTQHFHDFIETCLQFEPHLR